MCKLSHILVHVHTVGHVPQVQLILERSLHPSRHWQDDICMYMCMNGHLENVQCIKLELCE